MYLYFVCAQRTKVHILYVWQGGIAWNRQPLMIGISSQLAAIIRQSNTHNSQCRGMFWYRPRLSTLLGSYAWAGLSNSSLATHTAHILNRRQFFFRITIEGKHIVHSNKSFLLHRFSINFTLDECPDPPDVAYHFETRFNENSVAHNFKTNGNWHSEIVNENTWIEGTGTHCGIFVCFNYIK